MKAETEARLRKYNETLRGAPYPDSEWSAMVEQHNLKHNARAALRKKVNEGIIERQPCEMCGRTPSEGHHPDYRHEFTVVWLCRLHHAREHALLRRLTSETREHYTQIRLAGARAAMVRNIDHMQARNTLSAFFGE